MGEWGMPLLFAIISSFFYGLSLIKLGGLRMSSLDQEVIRCLTKMTSLDVGVTLWLLDRNVTKKTKKYQNVSNGVCFLDPQIIRKCAAMDHFLRPDSQKLNRIPQFPFPVGRPVLPCRFCSGFLSFQWTLKASQQCFSEDWVLVRAIIKKKLFCSV